MAYDNSDEFVARLDAAGELIKIEVFTDPILEISEITDRISKTEGGGKALLFQDTGTAFPVLMNAMGSYRRICMALGVNSLDDISKRMNDLFGQFSGAGGSFMQKLALLPQLGRLASLFPFSITKNAACQEVVYEAPDLDMLPVLKTWPADGGRFITLPIVHTVNPNTGERNAGMYRMQIFDKNSTGMHWHRHKTGAAHYDMYRKLGKVMPVAVALGGDPVFSYAATAPLPDTIDEYLFAGFLRGKAVPLVKCLTQDIEVPANADIVLEGYVDPREPLRREGPFGDHTGFYSLEDDYPVFHVTCITHRNDAIFTSTVVGIPPQEDAWIARATERIFMLPIRKTVVPELTDLEIPDFGVAHNLTLATISKSYPGQARKVMNALWGAGQMMFNKLLIIADETTDIHNFSEMTDELRKTDPLRDIVFSSGPLDVLDHSADFMGYGSKAGIDLTKKRKEELLQRFDVKEIGERTSYTAEESERMIKKFVYLPPEKDMKGFCLINIVKTDAYSFQGLCSHLAASDKFGECTFFIVTDTEVDTSHAGEFFWYVLNNVEPQRDVRLMKDHSGQIRLFADGTAKTRKHDGFLRPWPNPVVMDKTTIERVDRRWGDYNLGRFVVSPSVSYARLSHGEGAVALGNDAG